MLSAALAAAAVMAGAYAWQRRITDAWAVAAMLVWVLVTRQALRLLPHDTMAWWTAGRVLLIIHAMALPVACAVVLLRARVAPALLVAGAASAAAALVLAAQGRSFSLGRLEESTTIVCGVIAVLWSRRGGPRTRSAAALVVLVSVAVAGWLLRQGDYFAPLAWMRRGAAFTAGLLAVAALFGSGLRWTRRSPAG